MLVQIVIAGGIVPTANVMQSLEHRCDLLEVFQIRNIAVANLLLLGASGFSLLIHSADYAIFSKIAQLYFFCTFRPVSITVFASQNAC